MVHRQSYPTKTISIYMRPATSEILEMAHLHDSHGIIVENSWNVFRGEFVGGVADQQACLPNRTVADHHTSVEEA